MFVSVSPGVPQRARQAPHKPQPLEAAQYENALLRISTAAAFIGCGVSSLYDKAKSDPTFPRLIKFGTRCTRIRAGDLNEWVKSKAGG